MANLSRKIMAVCSIEEAPQDRRDKGRSRSGAPCACSLITLQQRPPFWPAKVRDLSPTGIGLLISRAVEPGTFLTIHFNTGRDKPLRAKVIHSTLQRQENGWVVGCELTQQLSADEVQALA